MSDVCVVLMTAPSCEIAEGIVASLVEERLIACGNIATIPVTSIYRWHGTTERAAEVSVIMKTTKAASSRVTNRIIELHPYDVPEILFLPVDDGLPSYLQWVKNSVA